jgi:hypothetical protein
MQQESQDSMFVSQGELEAGMEAIKSSPTDHGIVRKIVCRPDIDERRELQEAQLDLAEGLVGDNWRRKGYRKTADGRAHPDMQLNIMNARAIALVARTEERWQLAGDQFYVDLDLSPDNLPPGTRLQIGEAIIEITAEPHLGCSKFMARFGRDAAVFVNSDAGKELNLRGINAKVVQPGKVVTGSRISKLEA